MASLRELSDLGQSVWLDFIQRDIVRGGELAERIDGGLRGLTSNPSIFEHALRGSSLYDDDLRARLREDPGAGAQDLFEWVAVTDIREACDLFRPVYEEADRGDGLVSLEVSPRLADDTQSTLAEARRLWRTVDRPNLMIKVPATPAGLPAIEELTGAGINVNVTLIFSQQHYEAVAGAYLRGLERCAQPERVSSVASLFVSRVDTAVDKLLDEKGTPEAAALRGRIAVDNARLAYACSRELFGGSAFAAQRKRGARVQRVLFGSTGTKDAAYSDVKYVEELIGPDTVNTLPPKTIAAFLDHGRAAITLGEDLDGARERLRRLAALDIDLEQVTHDLQRAGVDAFARSFDQLLDALETRRADLVGSASPGSRAG